MIRRLQLLNSLLAVTETHDHLEDVVTPDGPGVFQLGRRLQVLLRVLLRGRVLLQVGAPVAPALRVLAQA